LREGQGAPPSPLYKGGTLGGEEHTIEPRALLHLSLACHLHVFSIFSLSRGLPKGYAGVETTPPLHAIMLRSFWIPSKAIYFHNLGWIGDSGACLDHRACVSTRRCCHLWDQSRFAKFFNDLEVGYIGFIINACAGAKSPRSVKYVSEALIVTVLLIDRYWEFRGCIDNNFLLLPSNPIRNVYEFKVKKGPIRTTMSGLNWRGLGRGEKGARERSR
jgi:hypothetical protein